MPVAVARELRIERCIAFGYNPELPALSLASSARPVRITALAQTQAVRFTRDVAVRHKPENGKHQKDGHDDDHKGFNP